MPLRMMASLALTAAVVFLSLVPGYPVEGDGLLLVSIGSVPSPLQNAMHFVPYGLLTLFWAAALSRSSRPTLYAVTLVVGLGLVLEFAQLFAPGRYASLLDVGLNTAGVLVGIPAANWLRRSDQRFAKALSDTGFSST